MSAGYHDLLCEQGATFVRTVTWKDENGTAIDLTGSSARMMVRVDAESASAVLDLRSTGESPKITINAPNGAITISVPAAQTAALSAGNYVYDLEVESAGGVVTRLLQGGFLVSREVTR